MPIFIGGEGEIRTRDRIAPMPVFKTGAFNRSATSPFEATATRTRILPYWTHPRPPIILLGNSAAAPNRQAYCHRPCNVENSGIADVNGRPLRGSALHESPLQGSSRHASSPQGSSAC